MEVEAPKTENLIIKTEKGNEGRTIISFYFDKKFKRCVEMKLSKDFMQKLLNYIENYISLPLFTGDSNEIQFEDYADKYKSFYMNLNPCDMEMFNNYYGTDHAEHQGSASFSWIKGPDAKRPSHNFINSTKKQLVGEIYKFIQEIFPDLKSELIESLLVADLYDYYERIK